MPNPKPKTDELMKNLIPSIDAGENLLLDIDLRRIINEARELPDYYQGIAIEGLALIVKGDLQKGIEFCDEAIRLSPYDLPVWTNYAVAIEKRFLYKKYMEVMHRSFQYKIPDMLLFLASAAAFWADIDTLNKVIPLMESMKIEEHDVLSRILPLSEKLNNYGSTAADISKMALFIMDIAEDNKLPIISNLIDDDGDGLVGYGFMVKTDDPKVIIRLNDILREKIIEHGLETSNCIGFFDPIEE